jgi:membrane protein required for colicin V production
MNGINVNMNIFDTVVLAIVGLSALVAFFRGFIRELLSLGAWVGAGIITLYCFPHTTSMMENHVRDPHIAAGVGAISTYIASLVGISIVNSIIIRYVKTGMEVGLLDNFLGLLFGALRGGFIVSVGYLIMTAVISTNSPPQWMDNSVTLPYVKQGSDILISLAPQYLNNMQGMVKDAEDKAQQEGQSVGSAGQGMGQGMGQTINNDAATYKQDIQNDLGQMINSTRQGAR